MSTLIERLQKLPAGQRAELSQSLADAKTRSGSSRLVAFVTPAAGQTLETAGLRTRLAERLPDYMLPHQIVALNALPLTPNGKVDREALAALDTTVTEPTPEFTEPASAIEQQLAEIWADVLGQDMIGVHDNFFEIGGDSILSIQIVARARRQGIEMTPALLFKHPTIAELAGAVNREQPAAAATEQGLVTGEAPLTPIQRWFFDDNLANPNHWNQAVFLRFNQPVSHQAVQEAVMALIHQHDALRARFTRAGSSWQQELLGIPAQPPLEWVPLDAPLESGSVEPHADRLHRSLRLDQGQLLRAAHLRSPDGQEGLLIVLHHLVVDAVSWGVLLEDLHTALDQLLAGATIQLPAKTTSFLDWSEKLRGFAHTPAAVQASRYWLSPHFQEAQPMPGDLDAGDDANIVGSMDVIEHSLSEPETSALLEEVPSAYHTQVNDILLAALAKVQASWCGASFALFSVEGHGREGLFEGVDLSRTVGWFTSVYPVRLEVPSGDDPGQLILSIKEQLRAIPDNGISHGLLKYSDRYARAFAGLPEPELVFNYLGRLDHLRAGRTRFRLESDSMGQTRDPGDRRHYLIEVNCFVHDGCFQSRWSYSRAVHHESTIAGLAQRFVQELRSLIEHCLSPQAGGRSRSDFPLADLDEDSFNQIAGLLDD